MKNLNKYELLSEYQTAKQSSGFSTPSASWCLEDNHAYFDDYDPDTYLKPITDYFTVEALEDGMTVNFQNTTGELYYSLDDGNTLTSYEFDFTYGREYIYIDRNISRASAFSIRPVISGN